MAFTRSMARRTWGRRAPRSSRPRRSRFPRRIVKAKRYGAIGSNSGGTNYMGFRSRRIPRNRYRRMLYASTQFQEHHRSVQTTTSAQLSATAANLVNNEAYPVIASNFWASTGGGLDGSPSIDSKIFIRGGIGILRIKNSHTETMNYILNVVMTTNTGTLPTVGTVDMAWDPTTIPSDQRNYRVMRTLRFMIEPGDVHTVVHRVLSRKIDQTDFNGGAKREYWILGINDFSGTTTGSSDVFRSHNISFVYDRYG